MLCNYSSFFNQNFKRFLCTGALLSRIYHSKYLLKIKHKKKIKIISISLLILISIIFLCYSLKNEKLGFSLSLTVTFLIGVCAAVGDAVVFGFMKSLPPNSYIGYSAGTGLSGVIGALLPILTTFFGFEIKWVKILFY